MARVVELHREGLRYVSGNPGLFAGSDAVGLDGHARWPQLTDVGPEPVQVGSVFLESEDSPRPVVLGRGDKVQDDQRLVDPKALQMPELRQRGGEDRVCRGLLVLVVHLHGLTRSLAREKTVRHPLLPIPEDGREEGPSRLDILLQVERLANG